MEKILSKSIQVKTFLLPNSLRIYFILFFKEQQELAIHREIKKRLKIKTLFVEQNAIFTTSAVKLNFQYCLREAHQHQHKLPYKRKKI
jgi:hypothetical protein